MNENLLIKREIKVFDFTDTDFYHPVITEKDKEFFSTLVADNYDWSYKKNGCLIIGGEKFQLDKNPKLSTGELNHQ
eukprot:gene2720-3916_t